MELRPAHRLRERHRQPLHLLVARRRAEADETRRAEPRVVLDSADERRGALDREVEHHDVEGVARRGVRRDRHDRERGRVEGGRLDVELLDHRPHRAARGGVVLDQHHPPAGQIHARDRGAGLAPAEAREPRVEEERRALARRARDASFAAHRLDQPLGEREAEPASAGRLALVHLRKRLEKAALRLFRDPDAGVLDLEADPRALRLHVGHRRPEEDLARLGELDRVRDEVQEHLAKAHRIALERRRDPRVDPGHELEAAALGALGEQLPDLVDGARQVERDAVDGEHVRLGLAEVEDVVEQTEERIAARADAFSVVPLLGRQVRVEQEPRDPDHAVQQRPDFVAQIGEPLRTKPRLLERCPRPPELDLELVTRRTGGRRASRRGVGFGRRAPHAARRVSDARSLGGRDKSGGPGLAPQIS